MSDWRERYKKPPWEVSRHGASIGGVVRDAATKMPIAGALVAIVAGPLDFEARLAAQAALPDADRRTEQLCWRLTDAAGRFVFLDLPPTGDLAESYRLRVSIPGQRKIYAEQTLDQLKVAAPGELSETPTYQPLDIVLQPTAIKGIVTRSDTHEAVIGARVRLAGAAREAWTRDKDDREQPRWIKGSYELSMLEAGTWTVEASIIEEGADSASGPKLQAFHGREDIDVAAGEIATVDIELRPV
jgi:hypothetical protein